MKQLEFSGMLEEKARDAALDLLEERRAELIAVGRNIALELAQRDGSTCSPRVLREMRARGYEVEKRPMWAGCFFRGKNWRKTGTVVHEGSHKRPASMWELV